MRSGRFTIIWKVGIPALIDLCEVITARDNFTRDLRANFREAAFLNDGRFQFRFEGGLFRVQESETSEISSRN
jgi:hypothetical protein